jgi:HEPN domain-containing protein
MSGERIERLVDRSGRLLRLANELYGRGEPDLASFCVEQACQLRVKAAMLRLLGGAPRTHGVRELLGVLARELGSMGYEGVAGRIRSFVRSRREELLDMEGSYVESRYGVFTLGPGEVERMLEAARELFKLLEEVEASVLG